MNAIFEIGFLICSVAFVIGLRMLNSPATARNGNLISAAGMTLGVLLTILLPFEDIPNNYVWVAAGLAIGSLLGWIMANKVEMTKMPEMVSILNGFGGACAVLIATVQLRIEEPSTIGIGELLTIYATIFIGGVSFTGSIVAYGKLNGSVKDRVIPQVLNLVLLTLSVGLTMYLGLGNFSLPLLFVLIAISLLYGVTFVLPIGGADMPVVISLLNSFTGITASLTGIIYQNNVMLLGGILVGSSGIILTLVMCQAMNRSLINVLIGSFAGNNASKQGTDRGIQVASITSANEVGFMLFYAKRVILVPGYGLAVAQAQRICKDLDDLLEANGVEVKYAIHPVAGRMPGHMNVLLAEADVSYDKLLDMETANDLFPQTDVVVVIGANDVVNPAAKNDPGSPIYKMPILDVEMAKRTIVLKRTMGSGYAGIENQLFFNTNNQMLLGDAKTSLQGIYTSVKEMVTM